MSAFSVADIPRLLDEMTLEEKASLCSGAGFWSTQPIERLGIDAIWVSDGPHGLRKQVTAIDHLGLNDSVPATCFPPATGLASTWDRQLVRRVGEALGTEARAHGVSVILGPGVNIKRSPLCGRNFEYFSEDPRLTGTLAAELVAGIQSRGVGASLKHFAANNQETDRMRVDVRVDERTLREIYLTAFEQVVRRAAPWTVMCSYNKVGGTYTSENRPLLTGILRDEWGFRGLVVSDWGAVNDRVAGLAAGMDLEMPTSHGVNDARIVAAVRSGDLPVSTVDDAVRRVLELVAAGAPAAGAPGEFDAAAHHDLAREAATHAAVLLKNDGGVLPLSPAALAGEVVLIGELARSPRYQGAGSSQVHPTRLESIRDGFALRGLDVPFAPGYRLPPVKGMTDAGDAETPSDPSTDAELRSAAVDLARRKTAVVSIGLPAAAESEGYDRTSMDLPGEQVALLKAIRSVADRVVVLLSNGAAVGMTQWSGDADAILELWLGGQAGGPAAVDLVIGAAAPSGHLAESIPEKLTDLPAQLHFPGDDGTVCYGEGIFVGYRGLDAMDRAVLFPFGHGLTYTTFEYTDLRIVVGPIASGTSLDDVVAEVSVTVANRGVRAGAAVPQLYVSRPESAIARPPVELLAFDRVELDPGDERRVEFRVTRRDLSYWDARSHGWVVEPGPVRVGAGESSRDIRLSVTALLDVSVVPHPLTAQSTIDEWLNHPEAGPSARQALGPFASAFAPDANPLYAAMMGAFPLVKVPQMRISPTMTFADLDRLVDRYGDRRSHPSTNSGENET